MKLIIVTLITIFISCAKPNLHFQPTAHGNQQVEYVNGVSIITSKQTYEVKVMPLPGNTDNELLNNNIHVFVKNIGNEPITLSLDSLTLLCGDKSVKLYSFDEVVAKENKKSNKAAFKNKLLGFMSLLGSPATKKTTVSGDYSSNTQPANYRYSYDGSNSYQTKGTFNATIQEEDKAATSLEQERLRQNIASRAAAIGVAHDSTVYFLNQNYLQTTTIYPGNSYGGLVKYKKFPLNANARPILTVHIGNDTHIFDL